MEVKRVDSKLLRTLQQREHMGQRDLEVRKLRKRSNDTLRTYFAFHITKFHQQFYPFITKVVNIEAQRLLEVRTHTSKLRYFLTFNPWPGLNVVKSGELQR